MIVVGVVVAARPRGVRGAVAVRQITRPSERCGALGRVQLRPGTPRTDLQRRLLGRRDRRRRRSGRCDLCLSRTVAAFRTDRRTGPRARGRKTPGQKRTFRGDGARGRPAFRRAYAGRLRAPASLRATVFSQLPAEVHTLSAAPLNPGVSREERTAGHGCALLRTGRAETRTSHVGPTSGTLRDRMLRAKLPYRHTSGW